VLFLRGSPRLPATKLFTAPNCFRPRVLHSTQYLLPALDSSLCRGTLTLGRARGGSTKQSPFSSSGAGFPTAPSRHFDVGSSALASRPVSNQPASILSRPAQVRLIKGDTPMADSPAAGLSKDRRLELARCCFTQKMSSCLDAFPLGIVIGKETAEEVHTHILDVHFRSISLLSQSNVDTRISPGLHFHLTPADADRIAAGECVDSDMLTNLFGRDRTLDGETPFCVLPTSEKKSDFPPFSPTRDSSSFFCYPTS